MTLPLAQKKKKNELYWLPKFSFFFFLLFSFALIKRKRIQVHVSNNDFFMFSFLKTPGVLTVIHAMELSHTAKLTSSFCFLPCREYVSLQGEGRVHFQWYSLNNTIYLFYIFLNRSNKKNFPSF